MRGDDDGAYLGEEPFSDDHDPGWGRPPGRARNDDDWTTPWDDEPVEPVEPCTDCGRIMHTHLCPTAVEQAARHLAAPPLRRCYAGAGAGEPADEVEWYALSLSGAEEAHWLAVVRRARQLLKAEPVSRSVTALEYLARPRPLPADAPPAPTTRPGRRKTRATAGAVNLFGVDAEDQDVSRRRENR